MPFQGNQNPPDASRLIGMLLNHQNSLLKMKADAESNAAAEQRANEKHQLEKLKAVSELISGLQDEQTAATGRAEQSVAKNMMPEEFRNFVQTRALSELGTANIADIASGTASSLGGDPAFTTPAERDQVISELIRLGRGDVIDVANQEYAPVQDQINRVSAASGIPAAELQAQLQSQMDESAVIRNRERSDKAGEKLRELDAVERSMDEQFIKALTAGTPEERQRAIDKLNARNQYRNRLTGGDNAVTATQSQRQYVFQAARNARDLDSMDMTIDAFRDLIRGNKDIAGVNAKLNLAIERGTGVIAELVDAAPQLMSMAESAITGDDKLSERQKRNALKELEGLNREILQGAIDLRTFGKLVALKVAQSSSPDRFAFALYEDFRDEFGFDQWQTPNAVMAKLDSAQAVLRTLSKNTKDGLSDVRNGGLISMYDQLLIDEIESGGAGSQPGIIPFSSLRSAPAQQQPTVTIDDLVDSYDDSALMGVLLGEDQ